MHMPIVICAASELVISVFDSAMLATAAVLSISGEITYLKTVPTESNRILTGQKQKPGNRGRYVLAVRWRV